MASDSPKTAPADSSPRPDPSTSRQSTTTQLPPYTSSSSPKVAKPRTSTNPHTLRPGTNPRLKLTLPPPPYPYASAEVLPGNSVGGGDDGLRNEDVGEEGQWFWYEGKRVYVGGNHRRVQSNATKESPMESSDTLPPPEDQEVEMNIGDDEYDCGYAMDLGAESPSPSIGGTPGLGSRSSSSSLFPSTSVSSISPSSSMSSQDARLAESITRKPGGAGAVYKREVECQEEAGDRLTREWAVAAGMASVVVEPMLSGKRSRGPSVSAAYPPVTGSTQVSRRSSRSAPQWDEADRDCGICFEYAVRPARTLCCGKLFCQEHLEDWLSGPNASGLCPNCDAECSLETDVLSLSAPKLVKQKSVKSSTGGRSSSNTTRRVSSSRLGLEPPSIDSRSSSSQPLLLSASASVSADDPPSPQLPTFSTTRTSAASTPFSPTMYLNVPQQTLLSPPPSRPFSRSPTPGQLSPRSLLLTSQQQYERLLAQEHRPSSPLSTNLPIVNPFDSVVVSEDVLGGAEALGSRRGVKREESGMGYSPVEFPSSGSIVELEDGDTDSEKGYGSGYRGKEKDNDMGMWAGLGKGKMVKESEADPAHAMKHAASLVGCLVVLYLVVR